MLWGFLIWATAHVPPNGTGIALLLFGVMALFSLLGFPLLDHKSRKRLGPERWQKLAAGTSVLPFAALLLGQTRWRSLRPLALPALIAAALYIWFVLQGHALLIGVAPLASLAAME